LSNGGFVVNGLPGILSAQLSPCSWVVGLCHTFVVSDGVIAVNATMIIPINAIERGFLIITSK
jgi:hypothetical protein